MITKAVSFCTSDKEIFDSIEKAQAHEIALVILSDEKFILKNGDDAAFVDPKTIAQWIVSKREQIIDLLTTKATSRPKARKANGAVKKSKTTAVLAPAA